MVLIILVGSVSRYERQNSFMIRNLDVIGQLDGGLNLLVLKLRYNLLSNYDQLVQVAAVISTLTRQLHHESHDFPYSREEGDRSLQRQLEYQLQSKIDSIEAFKSHNAVLKNFLLYAPSRIEQALDGVQGQPQSEIQRRLLTQLLVEITAIRSHEMTLQSVRQVGDTVNALVTLCQRDSANERGLILTATDISSHAVDYAVQVDQLSEKIVKDDSATLISRISEAYQRHYDHDHSRAIFLRNLFFILSVGSLGVIFYLGIRTQTKNRELASSVAEMTQLKHALNEHAIVSATDVHGNIIDVNEKFTEISGYRRDELLGHNHRLIKSDEHGIDFFRAMWRTIAHGKVWHGEIKNRKKNGGHYWTSSTIVPFLNKKGKPEKYLSIRTDITAIKDSQIQIDRLAYYDTLTELPNRHFFIEQLDREIRIAARHKTVLSLLFLDLDFFKEVNDTYGHDQGDLLLKEVALRLTQCVRAVDLVSRLGGDEFTVILTDVTQASIVPSTQRICRSIITSLSQPFQIGIHEVNISCSIGVALFPSNGSDSVSLIRNADRAMYVAKKQRSHHVFYSTLEDQSQGRGFDLSNALRHAIANHELSVHYQPIYDLQSGQLTKAEALLRWNNPSQGYVSPEVFIPIAEEFGLIHEMGHWVILQVVAFLARWYQSHATPLNIALNVSAIQFENDIGQKLRDVLLAANLPQGCITIEITEGILLRHSEKVLQVLKALRQEGIDLSIDDFGTGYSALSYLRSFEFDYLKIDRSFVKDMQQSEKSSTIIESIIQMAQRLGIRIIAEGIETQEQYEALKGFGCDLGQGYYFSPALPAKEFENLLKAQVSHPMTSPDV